MKSVLEEIFYRKGKKYRLKLTEEEFSWTPKISQENCRRLKVSEIVGCWLCPNGSTTCALNDISFEKAVIDDNKEVIYDNFNTNINIYDTSNSFINSQNRDKFPENNKYCQNRSNSTENVKYEKFFESDFRSKSKNTNLQQYQNFEVSCTEKHGNFNNLDSHYVTSCDNNCDIRQSSANKNSNTSNIKRHEEHKEENIQNLNIPNIKNYPTKVIKSHQFVDKFRDLKIKASEESVLCTKIFLRCNSVGVINEDNNLTNLKLCEGNLGSFVYNIQTTYPSYLDIKKIKENVLKRSNTIPVYKKCNLNLKLTKESHTFEKELFAYENNDFKIDEFSVSNPYDPELSSIWSQNKSINSTNILSSTKSRNRNERKHCMHWKRGRYGLSIEVCRKKGKLWKTKTLVFNHHSSETIFKWFQGVWNNIKEVKERPQRLLVIINPVSGRQKGLKTFQKYIQPLFKRAKIDTFQIKTDHQGHATSIIKNMFNTSIDNDDFDAKYDGILSVGGDGLVSEVITGLFLAQSKEIEENQEKILSELQIRVGIIPCGSTDATCYATHGTNDAITSALHVIMGDRRPIDVATIHIDGKLQRVVTSCVSYGYFGDLMKFSENYRWLGPPRYLLSGVYQIWKNKSYPVRIKLRKSQSWNESDDSAPQNRLSHSQTCSNLCSICDDPNDISTISQDIKNSENCEDWVEISGNYNSVSLAVTSCACKFTPKGLSPLAHLGDGNSDIILVSGKTRSQFLSYLYHTSVTGQAHSLGHVEKIRASEIMISPNETFSSYNCDGEQLESSEIFIKIHRKKLQLFCRGIED